MVPLTIAVAKGRTAERAISILRASGIDFDGYGEGSRKLVFRNERRQIDLLDVKAVDVPTYVEKGAADIGVIGKDILMEDPRDVYELADLGIGACKMAVAGFNRPLPDERLLVASKYPKIAMDHFKRKGIRPEVIKLNGSVELAPLIGLADVIVDIVETGSTLRENGLVVLEEIADISARLIVNKASYATKTQRIQEFIMAVESGKELCR